MPSDEDSYCFTANFDQHSTYGTVVAHAGCNGNKCVFSIEELYICEGNTTGHTLTNTAASANTTNHNTGHFHVITPVETAKFDITARTNFNCKTDTSFPHWDPTVALTTNAMAGDKFSVMICGTPFTNVIRVFKVEFDIDHVCTTAVHAVSHNVAVTATPNPLGINVDLKLRRTTGTSGSGDAVFTNNNANTIAISGSTNLTVLGRASSDAITNMVMEAKLNSCVCTSKLFTVVDVNKLVGTEGLHTVNTTNDTTQVDDTNTVWICQTSNDTAPLTLGLSWMPTNYPATEFWWDAVLTNGAAAPNWGGPGTFENNPTNITWTPGSTTNREFRIRSWFDCDGNDAYMATEPHRIIDVVVVDFVKLMLTNSSCSNSVVDMTRPDEPASTNNTLYLCESTNGTAEMSIQGWWLPENVNSNWFRWEIVLTNGAATTQWIPNDQTFATNPATTKWSATGPTNREFLVRGWYDCNRNGTNDVDEPHRSLYVTVLKVETETVATVPTNRTRKKVGVGEPVTLTLQPTPLSPVSWAIISGTGTLSAASGNPVTFTAHDRASTPTITATYGSSSCAVTFNVIEPSGVMIEQKAGTGIRHTTNTVSCGFKGTPYIQPDDVSFNTISVHEGATNGVATGYLAPKNGEPHAPGPWQSVGDDVVGKGSKVYAVDTISSGDYTWTPYADGTFTWDIPWYFRVGSGAEKQFKTVLQQETSDATGRLTISKGGTSKSAALTDPTSTY